MRRLERWEIFGTCVLLWYVGLLFFAKQVLGVDQSPVRSDCIVILGGGPVDRVPVAARLYREGWASKVLITGRGDDEFTRTKLIEAGVAADAIHVEGKSLSTYENARFSRPWFEANGCKKVLLVTTWMHARRARASFRRFAPDADYIVVPSYPPGSLDWPPNGYTVRCLEEEYLKLAWYTLRYGVR